MDGENGENGENNDGGNGGDQPKYQFTQEDLSRVGTREKDQGRKAGGRAVLEALGFNSLEEAKDFVASVKAANEAQLSEAQRAQAAAEIAKQQAQRDREEAQRERFAAKVERALLKAKADPDRLGRLSKLVEADVDSSDEDIATAVADLQKDFPELFKLPEGQEQEDRSGSGQNNGAPGSQPGTPLPGSDPGRQPGKTPPADSKSKAQALLEQRHGGRIKKP